MKGEPALPRDTAPLPLRITPAGDRRLQELLSTRTVPEPVQHLVEEYIARKTGKPWDDPMVRERIRTAIRAQKGEYWREGAGRRISYRAGYRVMAYLAYHFPVVFFQTFHLFDYLARAGPLPAHLRVLDVGTGPGVVPLALMEWYRRAGAGSLEVTSLEPSLEHREAFIALVPPSARGVPAVRVRDPLPLDLRKTDVADLPGPFDLIVFSNVLNEIPDLTDPERADTVRRFAGRLAPGGILILVEPADLANSTMLRRVVAILGRQGLRIRAPCVFPWGGSCPGTECWTFREEPPIRPTRLMAWIGQGSESYRYLNTDLKYSYAVLGQGGGASPAHSLRAGPDILRLSRLGRKEGRRVSVAAALMSGDLGNRDYHLYRICDGTAVKPVYAVVPAHRRGLAGRLARAGYGTLVVFREVLVRRNPAHDAFNLLVDRRAEVEVLPRDRREGTRSHRPVKGKGGFRRE
ncbi:MAG: methyltransferase domain-containing protein [Methanomicrobiales archaeon]|nr:methyltransferase domain-containing protein [Methanomicrobiales archaeon]